MVVNMTHTTRVGVATLLVCVHLCMSTSCSRGTDDTSAPAKNSNILRADGDELVLDHATPADLTSIHHAERYRVLDIEDAPLINDAEVKAITRFAGVEELYLLRCGIGDAGVRAIADGMPRLTHLNLKKAPISDAAFTHIARISGLQGLCVYECSAVTDDGIARLSGLQSLWLLSCNDCPGVTCRSIDVFVGMKALRRLYVSRTGLTRADVDELMARRPGLEIEFLEE